MGLAGSKGSWSFSRVSGWLSAPRESVGRSSCGESLVLWCWPSMKRVLVLLGSSSPRAAGGSFAAWSMEVSPSSWTRVMVRVISVASGADLGPSTMRYLLVVVSIVLLFQVGGCSTLMLVVDGYSAFWCLECEGI